MITDRYAGHNPPIMEDTPLVLPHDKASISCLPNELLEAIFKAGAADPRQCGVVPFPVLISAVNRKWYNIAVSSPVLWSRIFVTITPSVSGPVFLPSRNTLRTWFERSKRDGPWISLSNIPQIMMMILMIINLFMSSWSKYFFLILGVFSGFTVHAESLDYLDIFDGQHGACAPWLEHLELCTTMAEVFTDVFPFPIDTPSLKSLRLHGVRLAHHIAQLTLPRTWQAFRGNSAELRGVPRCSCGVSCTSNTDPARLLSQST